jgi:hypothetical protein
LVVLKLLASTEMHGYFLCVLSVARRCEECGADHGDLVAVLCGLN